MILAANQELLLRSFLSAGMYRSKSEIHRAGIEALVDHMPKSKRLTLAVTAYGTQSATISFAAQVAGIGFPAMKQVLADEGLLRDATEPPTKGAMVEFSERQ